jgi:glutathione S-transferase
MVAIAAFGRFPDIGHAEQLANGQLPVQTGMCPLGWSAEVNYVTRQAASSTGKWALLKIYADPATVNCRKVLAGLRLIEAPFELVHIDYFAGGHKTAEYLAINPNGALPAAVHGDFALSESNAILQYAADLYRAHKYYPTDPRQRADIHRWMLWEAATWFPSCYVYVVENVVKPLLFSAEPDAAVLDKEAPNWHRLADILDARLAKSRWLTGDGVTIADIAVAAPMQFHAIQRLPLDDHPHLKRWMTESIDQLPCWKATQAPIDSLVQARR